MYWWTGLSSVQCHGWYSWRSLNAVLGISPNHVLQWKSQCQSRNSFNEVPTVATSYKIRHRPCQILETGSLRIPCAGLLWNIAFTNWSNPFHKTFSLLSSTFFCLFHFPWYSYFILLFWKIIVTHSLLNHISFQVISFQLNCFFIFFHYLGAFSHLSSLERFQSNKLSRAKKYQSLCNTVCLPLHWQKRHDWI